MAHPRKGIQSLLKSTLDGNECSMTYFETGFFAILFSTPFHGILSHKLKVQNENAFL
jgi:hypothetical protein